MANSLFTGNKYAALKKKHVVAALTIYALVSLVVIAGFLAFWGGVIYLIWKLATSL